MEKFLAMSVICTLSVVAVAALTWWIATKVGYIDRNATFNAAGSSNPSDKLNTLRLNGTYHIAGRYAVSLGHSRTTGDSDATLYANSPTNGRPDSASWILQGTYLPWQNVQISAQYTWYTKFNGAKENYDGNGRNASDNNALYMLFWLMW